VILPSFPAAHLDLPDHQLGMQVWAWWLGAEATYLALPPGTEVPIDERFIEAVRRKVLSIDSDSVMHAGLEKALRRLASNDFAGGGKLFRAWLDREFVRFPALVDEVKTGRRKLRAMAKKPRPGRTDPLQDLIEQIIQRRPGIAPDEMVVELQKDEYGEVIQEVTETEIFHFKPKKREAVRFKISGLPQRMTKARKKISSS
jgi:hypothetical protein